MQVVNEPIINTQSFAQQIYDYLRDAILDGRYKCGDVINAKTLSLELGVSMMPVREALKKLEITGLLEIRPRSMCIVKTPSKKTIQAAMEMRELLEVFCVRKIYKTIDPEVLKPLEELNANMKEALSQQPMDTHKFVTNDWQFHCTLCGLADNEFVSNFYPELYIKVNMSTMYNIGTRVLNYDTFVQNHNDLIEALKQHSPKAIEIISEHMKNSQRNILGGKLFSGN